MDAVAASISCVCTRQRPFNPTKSLNSLSRSPKTLQILPPSSPQFRPFFVAATSLSSSSSSVTTEQKQEERKGDQDKEEEDDESMSIDALHRFIDLNLGNWNGSFVQYDSHGNSMQNVSTRLAVSSYGEDELVSLIQTLYIKQPPSATSVSGDDLDPEWAEYKIKETNMFTVDKYQQIGFFPKERAFSLRYQTAGMLEYVLRAGVLGEDDAGEEFPRNLKLPSRWPSVVCENCLYSQEKDMRARAFHIMDPKGILEMLLVFLEERGDGPSLIPSFNSPKDSTNRIAPLLGQWKGHSITKRSGVYGATIAEAETIAILEMDDKGQLIQDARQRVCPLCFQFVTAGAFSVIQTAKMAKPHNEWPLHPKSNAFEDLSYYTYLDITSTSVGGGTTNIHWTGTISNNLVVFDGGFQMTLLPGGMYMGCPCNVGKSVAQSQSFHLEFCWMESPAKRQRLVRTYDVEGLAVSSIYIFEVKV